MRIYKVELESDDFFSLENVSVIIKKEQVPYQDFVDYLTTKTLDIYPDISLFKNEGCYYNTSVIEGTHLLGRIKYHSDLFLDLDNLGGIESMRNRLSGMRLGSSYLGNPTSDLINKKLDSIIQIRADIIIEDRSRKLSQLL